MKRNIMLIFMLIFAATFTFAEGKHLQPTELPPQIQEFVAKNFPNATVKYAEKEWDDIEVILDDGTEIDFKGKGKLDAVKSKNPLPSSLLPSAAAEYITATYPDDFITEIDIDRRHYEVKLSGGWELLFDKDGSFVRIKDFDD